MTAEELIKELRVSLDKARGQMLTEIPSKVLLVAHILQTTIAEHLETLKSGHKRHQDVIIFCEELASFYLDCGNSYFKQDRNATTRISKMMEFAEQALSGINCSQKIKNRMHDTYQEWHWHGW